MTDIIQQIKSALDIESYIGKHVSLKASGQYLKACCPFHSEKTPSFVVNRDRQTWHCFGACSTGGDIFDFAQRQHGWDIHTAIQELAREAGIDYTPDKPRDDTTERLHGLLDTVAGLYSKLLFEYNGGKEALDYLHNRGISDATASNWRLGYAPPLRTPVRDQCRKLGYSDDDLLNAGVVYKTDSGEILDRFTGGRLVFTLEDHRGRVVGFAARALQDHQQPKYINSAANMLFDKSNLLYGVSRAKDTREVILVEGYMDALALNQAGYQAVAQMGTALTDSQAKLLSKYQQITLALDGDEAGRKAATRDIGILVKHNPRIHVLCAPDGTDPDDLIQSGQWDTVYSQRKPVIEYLLDLPAQNGITATSNISLRAGAAMRLMPSLLAVEDDLVRMTSVQQLALSLNIPVDSLLAQAGNAISKPVVQPEQDAAAEPKLEQYILGCLAHNPLLRAAIDDAFRIFRTAIEPEDFRYLTPLARQALSSTGELHLAGIDPVDSYSMEDLINAAFTLKIERLDAQAGALLGLDRADDAQVLLEQRSALYARFYQW